MEKVTNYLAWALLTLGAGQLALQLAYYGLLLTR